MLTLTTTSDLLITNQLLYRLSYASICFFARSDEENAYQAQI